jgi:hypothetical protein
VFHGWCGSVYIWLPRYGWTRPCLCVCVCVSLSMSARLCCVAAAVVVIMCRRWACCPMGGRRCAMVTRSVGGPQPRSSKATTGRPGQRRPHGRDSPSRAAEQQSSMSGAVAGVTVDALPGHGSDAEVQQCSGEAQPGGRHDPVLGPKRANAAARTVATENRPQTAAAATDGRGQ